MYPEYMYHIQNICIISRIYVSYPEYMCHIQNICVISRIYVSYPEYMYHIQNICIQNLCHILNVRNIQHIISRMCTCVCDRPCIFLRKQADGTRHMVIKTYPMYTSITYETITCTDFSMPKLQVPSVKNLADILEEVYQNQSQYLSQVIMIYMICDHHVYINPIN